MKHPVARAAIIRALGAEFFGSLVLAFAVVGSGIAAARLSPNDAGLQLAENAAAIALTLFALIVLFAPISGAHLNPLVSLVDAALGYRTWRNAITYIPAQLFGFVAGVVLGNLMFGLAPITISTNDRLTAPHFLSEVLTTAILILLIFVLARLGTSAHAPVAVAAYIGAAIFFTSSASFVNPSLTVARMLTNSFSGIAPGSVLGYIAAQVIGAALGITLVVALTGRPAKSGAS